MDTVVAASPIFTVVALELNNAAVALVVVIALEDPLLIAMFPTNVAPESAAYVEDASTVVRYVEAASAAIDPRPNVFLAEVASASSMRVLPKEDNVVVDAVPEPVKYGSLSAADVSPDKADKDELKLKSILLFASSYVAEIAVWLE